MLLLKPDADGHLYYAISGTGCDTIFGYTYQGRRFGEGLPVDAFEARKKEFERAVRDQKPLYSRVMLPVLNREFIEVYRGVFPFLSADLNLEAMVVVIAPIEQRIA